MEDRHHLDFSRHTVNQAEARDGRHAVRRRRMSIGSAALQPPPDMCERPQVNEVAKKRNWCWPSVESSYGRSDTHQAEALEPTDDYSLS